MKRFHCIRDHCLMMYLTYAGMATICNMGADIWLIHGLERSYIPSKVDWEGVLSLLYIIATVILYSYIGV